MEEPPLFTPSSGKYFYLSPVLRMQTCCCCRCCWCCWWWLLVVWCAALMDRFKTVLANAEIALKKKMDAMKIKPKKSKRKELEPTGPNLIDDLPEELLEKIFAYLPAEQVSRMTAVSQRWRRVVKDRRNYLPKIKRDYLEVQYGKWHDVIRYRTAYPYKIVQYELSETLGSASKRKMDKVPLSYITENCAFKVVLVNVQLLNGDLRPLLNFHSINAGRIVLNISHPSLQVRPLCRYMAQLVNDLAKNRRVELANFIFSRNHSPEVLNLLKPFASGDTTISVQGYA